MSGADAAIRQGADRRERRRLGAAEAAALADLAAQTRELIENVVLTDVDLSEIMEVGAKLAELNTRLSAARRDLPPAIVRRDDGMIPTTSDPVTGLINAIAPPVEMVALPDGTVRCEFTLSPVYEGPPGYVHGGVSAMILDHLLGNAAAVNGTPGYTATLSMAYRRPTPHGVPLVAEAKTVRTDGRKTYVDGWILGPDGKCTVEAGAMFILPLR